MRARREPQRALQVDTELGMSGMRPLVAEEHVHPVTPDGRPMHYVTKVDGVWACACGHVVTP